MTEGKSLGLHFNGSQWILVVDYFDLSPRKIEVHKEVPNIDTFRECSLGSLHPSSTGN